MAHRHGDGKDGPELGGVCFLVRDHSSYCQTVIVRKRKGSIIWGLRQLVILGRLRKKRIWGDSRVVLCLCSFWRPQLSSWKQEPDFLEWVRAGDEDLEVIAIEIALQPGGQRSSPRDEKMSHLPGVTVDKVQYRS